MTKRYIVAQTETDYIIYKNVEDFNIFANNAGVQREEIEHIGDVFISNNDILQVDIDCVPYCEIIGLICAIKTMHLNGLKVKIIQRNRVGGDYIINLAHQLNNLDAANRRKKKALRQADKDLKFLRNALNESYQEYNNVFKRLDYSEEENEELKTTIRELRASLDASITGDMLEMLDNNL